MEAQVKCGWGGDDRLLLMNHFYGDNNDKKVEGCGGAFQLSGAMWDSQWGGNLHRRPRVKHTPECLFPI
jgi:hypothetical protein